MEKDQEIIRVSKFKPTQETITFGQIIKKGKNRYIYIYINNKKKPLIQCPKMILPFPVNINEYSKNPEKYSSKKYDISLSFFSEYTELKQEKEFIDAFLLKLDDFDTIIKMKAVEYSTQWFNGKQYTLDQIEQIYLPSLRQPNKNFLPSLNVKIVNSEDSEELFDKTSFFNSKSEFIKIDSDEDLKELLQSKTIVKCIIKCAGIWIRDKDYKNNSSLESQKLEHQFGVSWELYQLLSHGQVETKKQTEYAFDDSSDSESDSESLPESD